MFDSFFSGIAWLLNFFYELVPEYAIAIGMLTLAVMLVTTPITLKGTKSMLQMQTLQPEMKRIQQKYKDDRETMNAELMKFYQENGINPLGGCLPLVLQAPIFILLFQLIQGMTNRSNGAESTFDPKYLDEASRLYRDLAESTQMSSFGIDLSRSASSAVSAGIGEAFPYMILIAIVAATSFYQQHQVRSRNPNAAQAPGAAVMKFLPLITVVFSYTFPAALVVYFVTSNLYRVGQQAYITRSLYGHDEAPGRKAQQAAAQAKKEKEREKAADGGQVDTDRKGYTPAKGRPTPSREEAREARRKAKSNRSKKKRKRR